jgi:hypothetical protein
MFNPYGIDSVLRGILKGKGFTLQYHDDPDPSRFAYTDGKSLFLRRPNMTWSREQLDIWIYAAFHEQGHNSTSCRDIFPLLKLKRPGKLLGHCLNIADDYRQERLNHGEYQGRDDAMYRGRIAWSKQGHDGLAEQKDCFEEEDKLLAATHTLYVWSDWLRSQTFMPGLPVNKSMMKQRELDWFTALMDHQDLATIDTAEKEYEWTLRVLRDVFKIDDKDINKPPERGEGKGEGESGQGGESGKPVYGTVKYDPNVDDHGTGESEGCKILYENTYSSDGAFIPCVMRDVNEGPPLYVEPTNLSKQVSRLVQIRSKSRWEDSHKSGRLGRRLHRVQQGKDDVFRRKIEALTMNKAVSILVDCSGSMARYKLPPAKQACYLLAEAIQPLRVPLEINGFFDTGRPEIFPVLKFGQKLSNDVLKRRINGLYATSCNDDYSAILYAYNRLMQQQTAGHALIVLSDGSPAPSEGRNQIDAVARLVKELQKRIEVYGIGICDDNVKYIYSNHQVLHDPQELPNVLFKLLERVIK